MRLLLTVLVASLSVGLLPAEETAVRESLPEGAKVEKISVRPAKIQIDRKHAYSQLLVSGHLAGGDFADLTRMAKLQVSNPKLIAINERGKVTALADGECEITVDFGGMKLKVPVVVSGQTERYVASFVQDVQPLLSRMGCNQGTCHGSLNGKNGFKLSLRGNDYRFDHRALTDDLAGRRFNRAAPDRSLFLLKSSGTVPHVGGQLTTSGEPYYEVLKSWVGDGVKLDLDSSRVAKIEIFPKNRIVPMPGMRQQISVLATFTDGKVRDVTSEAFVSTSNIEVTDIDRHGVVTAVRRGECAILARYEGRYDATQLIVMGDRSGYAWSETPEYNKIDGFVYQKLRKIKALASDVCTDAEFLRRISLDLTGLPPSSREVRAFLLDTRDSKLKRDELVDRLIGSVEFVEYWSNKWADLLQVNPKWLGGQGAGALRNWIRGAVASNMPYDQFVSHVLADSGSTIKNPPASYYKVLRTPEAVMENTTQLFLGIRFNCNKCHDHPFEKWTQNNYWELSAFWAQVDRKDAPGSRKMPRRSATQTSVPAFEEIIGDKKDGDISYPNGGKVPPQFPYPVSHAEKKDGAARRQALAAWVTSKENPYFAKSYVNRVWSYFLGMGLIDPVDDIRAGNPPSNPELLDWLTQEFIASDFDTRHIMKLILRSRTYRHSIRTNKWNADDEVNFSHAAARRLQAETLFDAIHMATGRTIQLPGKRRGVRAVEAGPEVKLGDGFLDLFGRPPRESACECERSSGMSLGQALNLVNGPTVAEAIRDSTNDIAELVRVERNAGNIVEELYLSILSRPPSEIERTELAKSFDTNDPSAAEGLVPTDAAELAKRIAKWESSQNLALWQPLEINPVRSAGGATLTRTKDGSILVSGKNPDKDVVTLVAHTNLQGITGLQLEVLPHDSLKAKGPGRAENGNFVLEEISVVAASLADPTKTQAIKLQNATQSFAQKDLSAGFVVDGKIGDKKGWAVGNQFGRANQAVFETKENFGFEGGTLLTITLNQGYGGMHTIGHFRMRVATSPRPVRHATLPANVIAAIVTPADKRTPEHKRAIFTQYIRGDQEMRDKMRLGAAQDLTWALINSPAFLFNR